MLVPVAAGVFVKVVARVDGLVHVGEESVGQVDAGGGFTKWGGGGGGEVEQNGEDQDHDEETGAGEGEDGFFAGGWEDGLFAVFQAWPLLLVLGAGLDEFHVFNVGGVGGFWVVVVHGWCRPVGQCSNLDSRTCGVVVLLSTSTRKARRSLKVSLWLRGPMSRCPKKHQDSKINYQ